MVDKDDSRYKRIDHMGWIFIIFSAILSLALTIPFVLGVANIG